MECTCFDLAFLAKKMFQSGLDPIYVHVYMYFTATFKLQCRYVAILKFRNARFGFGHVFSRRLFQTYFWTFLACNQH